MMNNLAEEAIRKNCPHCNIKSFALEKPLFETDNFRVVCDVHPITSGHILIIPKEHISCIGAYSDILFNEFLSIFEQVSQFIKKNYGSVSTFEHGVIGQTVFHSHVHLFPFTGKETDIVPEGDKYLTSLNNFQRLKEEFQKKGKYLYFSIDKQMWFVDISLSAPRFFRDRFSKALGHPERGNWKEMHKNKKLMAEAEKEITNLQKKWQEHSQTLSVLVPERRIPPVP